MYPCTDSGVRKLHMYRCTDVPDFGQEAAYHSGTDVPISVRRLRTHSGTDVPIRSGSCVPSRSGPSLMYRCTDSRLAPHFARTRETLSIQEEEERDVYACNATLLENRYIGTSSPTAGPCLSRRQRCWPESSGGWRLIAASAR
jgi:hypothetical protein